MSISVLPRFAYVDQISDANTLERLKSNAEGSDLTNFSRLWLSQNAANDVGNSLLGSVEGVSLNLEKDAEKLSDVKGINYECGSWSDDFTAISAIPPLRKHERPAVGVFVHPDITPGFRYWVRRNGSLDYLFSGKSVYLENVSQCCGKRFTFEADGSLGEENFFWSDSNMEEGFAFAVDVLSVGDRFDVMTETGSCGVAEILKVSDGQEILTSTITTTEHLKEVQVNFRCRITKDSEVTTTDAAGIASLRKLVDLSHAELLGITALFLPCGDMHTLIPKLETV